MAAIEGEHEEQQRMLALLEQQRMALAGQWEDTEQLEMLAEALLILRASEGMPSTTDQALQRWMELLLLILYPDSCRETHREARRLAMAAPLATPRKLEDDAGQLISGATILAVRCVESIKKKAQEQGRLFEDEESKQAQLEIYDIAPDYSQLPLPFASGEWQEAYRRRSPWVGRLAIAAQWLEAKQAEQEKAEQEKEAGA